MKNNVIVSAAGAFLLSCVWILWPMASTVATVRAQTEKVTRQADLVEQQVRSLPQLQSEIAAYRTRVVQLAGDPGSKKGESGTGRASDALIEATQVLETAYRVRITDSRLDGPLPRPTPQSVTNPAFAPPTPPPMAVPTPPGSGAGVAVTPTPTPSPVPGFYAAMNISDDPVAQVMDVYAGSFTIHGDYRELVGTLQDLPRQGALMRIISGGVCRDDRYAGKDRALTVAFRLYMLPPGTVTE